MKKSVFDYLLELPLSDDQRQTLKGNIREVSFVRGESVFSQGDDVKNLYALVSGLIKLVYYTPGGKELTKSFIQEGDIFGSLVSQMGMGGSTFTAVCLEGVEVQVLPYSVLEGMIDDIPVVQKFAMNLFRNLALKKEMREYEFLCLSAEERYHRFLEQNPVIAKRIAQQELARYLGITPIALSRLKHRKG